MPETQLPSTDKEKSPPRQLPSSLASPVPGDPADSPPHQRAPSTYPALEDLHPQAQPTYSETILQRPVLAIDPSTLPPQALATGPSSATSRRQSSSSMRNASMNFENVTPSQTPTGRVSKAKKGKRVHACEFPGCGKVFTRAEHRRRHELNHDPEATFRCNIPGCSKSFHRIDLLQRHQERHDSAASPSLSQASPHHSGHVFTSPPSAIPSQNFATSPSDPASRTTTGLSIGSLVHPQHPHSHYNGGDSSLNFGMFMLSYSQTVDPYFYGSEGSSSPASDRFGQPIHRQSLSSASSVAAYDHSTLSPTMTSSMPGGWLPATAAPPMALPDNVFEQGQTNYTQSTPFQYNASANWMDMNMLQYEQSYQLYPDSYSTQIYQRHTDTYDPIA